MRFEDTAYRHKFLKKATDRLKVVADQLVILDTQEYAKDAKDILEVVERLNHKIDGRLASLEHSSDFS